MALAEAGRHAEALVCVREHLLRQPTDGEALNDAGVILYVLGRYDEAARHLETAVRHLDKTRPQALWNLIEVHLAAGRPDEAVRLFDEMSQAGLLTPDLANRTAGAFLEREDLGGAVETILRGPRHEGLADGIIGAIKRLRPKVGVFCEAGADPFLQDVLDFVSRRFEVRLLRGLAPREMAEMLTWCDIAWFEWCTPRVVFASRLPRLCRTVVRLHRCEAAEDWASQVSWGNIDVLVLPDSGELRDRLREQVPRLGEMTRIVELPTGVNTDKFTFTDRLRGKNLACIGSLSGAGNPQLILQCFAMLHEIDPEYRLFFDGMCYDRRLYSYLQNMIAEMRLAGCVRFDGWQEDADTWLADKHVLVVGGPGEGHPAGVLEGMARGIKPLIHTFPGARALFPDEFLFRNAEEFCDRILEGEYQPRRYRRFVADNFPPERPLRCIDAILRRLEKTPLVRLSGKPAGRPSPVREADS